MEHGIRANAVQFLHQLLQVLFVGLTIGMMRTVVPALAEVEFGVPKNSFMLLTAFVVAFGVVKALLNLAAGQLSERLGRKKVLLLGWYLAVPIPPMIWFAPSWAWIVGATVLLGVNQGLTWSMTQTAKLDITRADERGLTIGLNEFSGYVGVALAGIVTAYLADRMGARAALLAFGLAVVLAALFSAHAWVEETLPWARAPQAARDATPTGWELFALITWRDRRFMAINQAGLVEKFVDAWMWVIFPAFLYRRGVGLPDIGWIIGTYGFVWGLLQLFTGRLSDRIGRQGPNVAGMWICGAGVLMAVLGQGVAWWSISAGVAGAGMALLYPSLSAAVADIAPPAWRGSAIGIYRFWRDLGYGAGALGLGLMGHFSGRMESAFWFVALSMFASGALLWWLGEETLPKSARG